MIIAKRGRIEHLRKCLSFLNQANVDKKYDIYVYVISDDVLLKIQDIRCYKNIVIYSHIIINTGIFNKSKLLNKGLESMRQDYDFMSIVDLDIMYSPDFFNSIVEQVTNEIWLISGWYKLDTPGTDIVLNTEVSWSVLSNYIDQEFKHENNSKSYPSQVTLSKELYEKILGIIETTFYDEGFLGWGGEDSVPSHFSTDLQRSGILKKIYHPCLGYHLYHEKIIDELQYKKNHELFINLIHSNKEKIRKVLNDRL